MSPGVLPSPSRRRRSSGSRSSRAGRHYVLMAGGPRLRQPRPAGLPRSSGAQAGPAVTPRAQHRDPSSDRCTGHRPPHRHLVLATAAPGSTTTAHPRAAPWRSNCWRPVARPKELDTHARQSRQRAREVAARRVRPRSSPRRLMTRLPARSSRRTRHRDASHRFPQPAATCARRQHQPSRRRCGRDDPDGKSGRWSCASATRSHRRAGRAALTAGRLRSSYVTPRLRPHRLDPRPRGTTTRSARCTRRSRWRSREFNADMKPVQPGGGSIGPGRLLAPPPACGPRHDAVGPGGHGEAGWPSRRRRAGGNTGRRLIEYPPRACCSRDATRGPPAHRRRHPRRRHVVATIGCLSPDRAPSCPCRPPERFTLEISRKRSTQDRHWAGPALPHRPRLSQPGVGELPDGAPVRACRYARRS
ncbi:hypothetical protein HBB16_11725 [Pseudonocardia sp. MCCB 268]|nr:hypothetical protein [Pseudonocardia cytotoxica]